MYFISTRGNNKKVIGSKAIIDGLCDDGGLYVPIYFPNLKDKLTDLINLSYKELCFEILKLFLDDFSKEELMDCINKAYDDKFDCKEIVPTVKIGNNYFLELYHGPTCAFKDIALTLMPLLLEKSIQKNNIKKDIVILTATSGDTGKAALEGFKNLDKIKIIVFFPEDGVSTIQKLQMKTQEGNNAFVVSINGNFDDAQSAVKNTFNDKNFNKLLKENRYILSSANSINIGRLLPQVVYYFYSYFELIRNKNINLGDKINFIVPTGNFGNILAAYYSKQMGLPVNKLICASNENNVLYDFFTTGKYDKNRKLHLTTSPSMDILISSNLERLLFEISNRNGKKVNELINSLNTKGFYEIDKNIKNNLSSFIGEYATEKDVKEGINKVFNKYNYLIDTHTSVAYTSYEKYLKNTNDNTTTVIVSTASPYKFAKDVLNSLDKNDNSLDEFHILNKLSKETNTQIPLSIKKLQTAKVLHNRNCEKNQIKKEIKNILKV
ncbi:threonine synthase [Terrisporobacter sp.]